MIVGLTQRILYHNNQSYDSTDQDWYRFFKDHTVVCIQNRIDQDFEKLANTLDVLVITGGNDPTLRRLVETKLAALMLIRNKPVLGVCHGAFLLTELNGGKVGEINDHHNVSHEIIVDGNTHTVNSYHSLCIESAPPSATVLAVDHNGICECWIDRKQAAIVWHPERMQNPYLPAEIQTLFEHK